MDTSWLAALDARIEREILRLRVRYELSLDELKGLYISDAQVDQLVSASRGDAPAEPAALPSRPRKLAGQMRDGAICRTPSRCRRSKKISFSSLSRRTSI